MGNTISKNLHLLHIFLLGLYIYEYYCLGSLYEAADLKDLSKLALRISSPNVMQYFNVIFF